MVEEQLVGFAPPSRRHVRMISQAIKSFGANRGGDSVVTFGVLMHDCLHAISTVPTAIFQQSNFNTGAGFNFANIAFDHC